MGGGRAGGGGVQVHGRAGHKMSGLGEFFRKMDCDFLKRAGNKKSMAREKTMMIIAEHHMMVLMMVIMRSKDMRTNISG